MPAWSTRLVSDGEALDAATAIDWRLGLQLIERDLSWSFRLRSAEHTNSPQSPFRFGCFELFPGNQLSMALCHELKAEFREMTNEPRSGELLPEHYAAMPKVFVPAQDWNQTYRRAKEFPGEFDKFFTAKLAWKALEVRRFAQFKMNVLDVSPSMDDQDKLKNALAGIKTFLDQTRDEDRPMMPEINARDERRSQWQDRRDRRKQEREQRRQRRDGGGPPRADAGAASSAPRGGRAEGGGHRAEGGGQAPVPRGGGGDGPAGGGILQR